MDAYRLWISFYTMIRKDVVRIFRIWPQTLLPSVITSVLYFLVFGTILGERIGEMQGIPYLQFVVSGLVMLAIVTNSYTNTSFTFFTSKFFVRHIDEILVSPTPPWLLVAGFAGGGVVRGIIAGLLVIAVSLFFTGISLSIHSIFIIFSFAILTSLLFSLAGLVNGIYAKSMDGINIVPTFVLTPLVYLGGVFYSVEALPGWWQALTYANPLFYIINGFRYGFLGFTDVALGLSYAILGVAVLALVFVNWYLVRTGLGLKE